MCVCMHVYVCMCVNMICNSEWPDKQDTVNQCEVALCGQLEV